MGEETDGDRRARADAGGLLLTELRRLQPDVDLVLVRDDDVDRPDPPRLGPDATASLERGIDERVASLLDAARIGPTTPVGRWQRIEGEAHRYVVRASLRGLTEDGALDHLRRLREHLLDSGWDARPLPGARPRMRATDPRGRLRLEASALPASVDVSLRSWAVVPDPAALAARASGGTA